MYFLKYKKRIFINYKDLYESQMNFKKINNDKYKNNVDDKEMSN